MICANCHRGIPRGVRFCVYCGSTSRTHGSPRQCSGCRRTIPPAVNFCVYCGSAAPAHGPIGQVLSYALAHKVQSVAALAAMGLAAVLLFVILPQDGLEEPLPIPVPTPAPPALAPTTQPSPTLAPTPNPPTPTPAPTPSPLPTHTPIPTSPPPPTLTHTPAPTSTPTHTPVPTETPAPQPTFTPTPLPTATPTPPSTPTPTLAPTSTPRPVATAAPTSTPTITPLPTSGPPPLPPVQEITFKHGDDTHKYEIRRGGSWAWMTSAPSAGGRPYINVTIVAVEDGEGRWDFAARHRDQRRDLAPTYADYGWRGGGNCGPDCEYVEFLWQPKTGDCRYDVVEHALPSWNAPGEYGFIISAGICEADLPTYGQQRIVILDSFNEVE